MKSLFVLSVLLSASMAQAEPRFSNLAPYVASAAGQFGDAVTSIRFSSNGSGCTEANGRFQNADRSFRSGKGLAVKGAIVGGSWVLLWTARRTGSKAAARIAAGVNYLAGAVGGSSAVRNVAICGF